MKPTLLLPLCGLLLASAYGVTAPRRYKVELAYSGFLATSPVPDCVNMMNVRGYDSLIGTVQADEPAAPNNEDVVYTGTVRRTTDIDTCLTRPKSAATPDELVWCKITIKGSAEMNIEITVHVDEGTGAYLHAEAVPGSVQNFSVNDGCQTEESRDLRSEYPAGATLASPDGQFLSDPANSFFVRNGLPLLRAGYSPPEPPKVAWGMRVTPLP